MLGDQLFSHHNVRARGADVAGGACVLTIASEELDLDGDRELLVFPHSLGRLAVDHDSTVPERPARRARALLADEPIFDPQAVLRKRTLVEQVPELTVELGVLIIGNLQDPIFDAERIAKVLAEGVSRDLRLPSIKVLAVEQWDPRFLARDILTRCVERAERDGEQET